MIINIYHPVIAFVICWNGIGTPHWNTLTNWQLFYSVLALPPILHDPLFKVKHWGWGGELRLACHFIEQDITAVLVQCYLTMTDPKVTCYCLLYCICPLHECIWQTEKETSAYFIFLNWNLRNIWRFELSLLMFLYQGVGFMYFMIIMTSIWFVMKSSTREQQILQLSLEVRKYESIK